MDDLIMPSYQMGNFATGPDDAEFPELWEGLVGQWSPSLGPTGLELPDSSGNGNPGQMINMIAANNWVVSSRGVWVLDYDHLGNTYVDLLDTSDIISTPFSLSAWFIPTLIDIAFAFSILGKRIQGSDDAFQLDIRGADEFHFTVWIGGVGNTLETSTSPISINTLYHAVAIHDGTNLFLYLNGNEIATGSAVGNMDNTADNIHIGREFSSSFDFNGQIGDVSIYNRVLLPEEIAGLAAGASPLTPARRLVGRAPLGLEFAVDVLDGKVTIINTVTDSLDGKVTVTAFEVDVDQVDGTLIVQESNITSLDGRLLVRIAPDVYIPVDFNEDERRIAFSSDQREVDFK